MLKNRAKSRMCHAEKHYFNGYCFFVVDLRKKLISLRAKLGHVCAKI